MLNKGYAYVEPFVADVTEKRCSGCRMCESVCVANAIKYDARKRVVKVEEAQCMGCGLCNATCPSSAVTLLGYSDMILMDEISGLLARL
ncbi:MAG: 4Fe-4S dicluster domain-containing protein [Deltaproteobacteria bacterium]|nr:4Fe-4S dicluster domain-containing protein [Deltaproteobacteria bacterium]